MIIIEIQRLIAILKIHHLSAIIERFSKSVHTLFEASACLSTALKCPFPSLSAPPVNKASFNRSSTKLQKGPSLDAGR